MKLTKYNYITIIAIVIIAGIIIGYSKQESTEGFVPAIHQMYRPYIRHGRIYTNNLKNYVTSHSIILFKKMGLY
jgi:hypothetical protein